MLFDELLRDAVAQERSHLLAEGLRHSEFDLPRRGLVARWRARRVARSTTPIAVVGPAPAPTRSPERPGPPIVALRRTMPEMYR